MRLSEKTQKIYASYEDRYDKDWQDATAELQEELVTSYLTELLNKNQDDNKNQTTTNDKEDNKLRIETTATTQNQNTPKRHSGNKRARNEEGEEAAAEEEDEEEEEQGKGKATTTKKIVPTLAQVEDVLLQLRRAQWDYPDDTDIKNIPLYVKYNRARRGELKAGDRAPDVPLVRFELTKDKEVNLLPTSLLAQSTAEDRPMMVCAGSYT